MPSIAQVGKTFFMAQKDSKLVHEAITVSPNVVYIRFFFATSTYLAIFPEKIATYLGL